MTTKTPASAGVFVVSRCSVLGRARCIPHGWSGADSSGTSGVGVSSGGVGPGVGEPLSCGVGLGVGEPLSGARLGEAVGLGRWLGVGEGDGRALGEGVEVRSVGEGSVGAGSTGSLRRGVSCTGCVSGVGGRTTR